MAEKKQGDVIEFSGHLKLPCAATSAQVIEWVEYETGVRSNIQLNNPLRDHDLDAHSIRCEHYR